MSLRIQNTKTNRDYLSGEKFDKFIKDSTLFCDKMITHVCAHDKIGLDNLLKQHKYTKYYNYNKNLYYHWYRQAYNVVVKLYLRFQWLIKMFKQIEHPLNAEDTKISYDWMVQEMHAWVDLFNGDIPPDAFESAKQVSMSIKPHSSRKIVLYTLPEFEPREHEVNNLLGTIQRYYDIFGRQQSVFTSFHKDTYFFYNYANIILNMAIEDLLQVEEVYKQHIKFTVAT